MTKKTREEKELREILRQSTIIKDKMEDLFDAEEDLFGSSVSVKKLYDRYSFLVEAIDTVKNKIAIIKSDNTVKNRPKRSTGKRRKTGRVADERMDSKINTAISIIRIINDFGTEKGISPNVINELNRRIEQI